jgi:hypothetical protein
MRAKQSAAMPFSPDLARARTTAATSLKRHHRSQGLRRYIGRTSSKCVGLRISPRRQVQRHEESRDRPRSRGLFPDPQLYVLPKQQGRVKATGLLYPCSGTALFDSGPAWDNQGTNFIVGGPRVEKGCEIEWTEFEKSLLAAIGE